MNKELKNIENGNFKILLIGPLPLIKGGATVLFSQLVDELKLKNNVQIDVIDNSRENIKSIFQNVSKLLLNTFKLIVKAPFYNIVSIHSSTNGTVFFGFVVYLITRFYGKPLVVRQFGGMLDDEYMNMPKIQKKILETVFKSEAVLIETKRLVNFFKNKIPSAKIIWYPNSRPKVEISGINNQNGKKLSAVFIGHVKPSKGVFIIKEAAEKLKSLDLQIDVYGPLMEGVKEDQISNDENVFYKGVLEPNKVLQTLAGYDVLVFPTFYEREGYPGVIIEAYMAGIPVITTNWISIPEIVEDDVSGKLIEPKSALSLANALESLYNNPGKLKELKQRVGVFSKNFSSVIWTDKFLEVCLNIVSEKVDEKLHK